jgi:hypothetical protein
VQLRKAQYAVVNHTAHDSHDTCAPKLCK